jgi:hypothetical protein
LKIPNHQGNVFIMVTIPNIPHLQQHHTTKQLVVNGKPFLMLGGELQNSSMSSAEHMSEIWPKMVATNVNTILGCVPWDMVEPEEGKFDFSELDKVILAARGHGLHLILLWFGSWKNGRLFSSCVYAGTELQKVDRPMCLRGSKRTRRDFLTLSCGKRVGSSRSQMRSPCSTSRTSRLMSKLSGS